MVPSTSRRFAPRRQQSNGRNQMTGKDLTSLDTHLKRWIWYVLIENYVIRNFIIITFYKFFLNEKVMWSLKRCKLLILFRKSLLYIQIWLVKYNLNKVHNFLIASAPWLASGLVELKLNLFTLILNLLLLTL